MINIAKLLKNCPEGTKLYSPLFGEVKFKYTIDSPFGIVVEDSVECSRSFDKYGRYFTVYNNAECLLFPSKECRTWQGWTASIEPKFKVGDWLVYKNGGTFYGDLKTVQVQTVEKDWYIFTHGTKSTQRFIDSECRLWAIQDAEDGDVLVSRTDNPFIYNGNIEFSCAGAYVGVSRDGRIMLDMFPSKVWTGIKEVKPATEEQRDLLFARIREVGYEWDTKKKELRKIVNPKFQVGKWIVYNENRTSLPPRQIIRITGNRYIVSGNCAYDFKTLEADWRLWTIADAKDGDILARNWYEDGDSWEKIIIFKNYHAKGVKGLFKNPCIEGYGNTFKNGKLAFREEVPYYSKTWTDNLQPATAKQRDLLFTKMKEAGYEWDADKKELRKIKPHYDITNFKPKQWVLVRDDDEWEWALTRFSYLSYGSASLFVCINGASFQQCIPFEDNEKLLGTTDECDEQYINW